MANSIDYTKDYTDISDRVYQRAVTSSVRNSGVSGSVKVNTWGCGGIFGPVSYAASGVVKISWTII